MKCFRCGGEDLALAPLTPWQRKVYAQAGWVIRICRNCGLGQNQVGLGEPLTPEQAAEQAPPLEV